MVTAILVSSHGLLKVFHDAKVNGSVVGVFSRHCFLGLNLLDGLQGPLFDWDGIKTCAGRSCHTYHGTCHIPA